MPKPAFLSLIAIASIPFIITLGNSMLIPILPVIERQVGISPLQSSLIITVYSIVAVVFIPLAGLLSDRVGRKKVILPSLAISGAGGIICGLASLFGSKPFYLILLGRLVQGIGAAGAFPMLFPLAGDVFSREEDVSHALGVAETANTIGKVLSPILGTLFAHLAWYLPFFVIPVLSLSSLLMIALWIDSSKPQAKPVTVKGFLHQLMEVLKEEGRWLAAVFLSGIIIMTILFGLLVYLSKFLEDAHQIFGTKKGLLLAIPLFSISLASYLTGKFIGKDKPLMRRTILTGLSLAAAASIAMVYFHGLWQLLLMISLAGLGIGISLPSLDSLVTKSVEREQRGSITSVYSGMRYAGVALGPPLFSLLLQHSADSMFLTSAGLALAAVVLVSFLIRPPDKKS